MFDPQAIIDSIGREELKALVVAAEKKLSGYDEDAALGDISLIKSLAPEGTKYLSSEELDLTAAAFETWRTEAKTPLQNRSRSRLWLAFLLLRYGALRLGEVLSLDDEKDIQPARCLILVRGAHTRQVLLPAPVMEKIATLLASPMFYGLRGNVLKLDQGYLRRKFYQRARDCGLPHSLFNPRVIRQSRGLELLRQGMPLQVVQPCLGLPSLPQSANYLEFSSDTVSKIMHYCINREIKMKTSARNAFTGKISAIKSDGLLAEVEIKTLSGLCIVSVITEQSRESLGLAEGGVVTAAVKAPWVIICTEAEATQSSARNKLPGKVISVKKGEVACEVNTELADGSIVSAVVTRESIENLELAPGREVLVLFKAFSVILNV
jgi:molybdate transport system regulatory protein